MPPCSRWSLGRQLHFTKLWTESQGATGGSGKHHTMLPQTLHKAFYQPTYQPTTLPTYIYENGVLGLFLYSFFPWREAIFSTHSVSTGKPVNEGGGVTGGGVPKVQL